MKKILILIGGLLFWGCEPSQKDNNPPEITQVQIIPQEVKVGETATVVVSASDPDGDKLTYTYTCTKGTITGKENTATYTAPQEPGDAVITVSVSDGKATITETKTIKIVKKDNGNGNGNGKSADYFPIKDGNSWTYNISTGGTETCNFNGLKTVAGGVTVNIYECTSEGETIKEYLKGDKNGVKFYGTYLNSLNEDFIPETPVDRLQYPLEVGKKWQGSMTANVAEYTINFTIIAHVLSKETVIVPAGTYNDCFKVQYETKISGLGETIEISYMTWYAPNIGPVKSEVEDPEEGTIRKELQSTNVKP